MLLMMTEHIFFPSRLLKNHKIYCRITKSAYIFAVKIFLKQTVADLRKVKFEEAGVDVQNAFFF